MQDTLFFYLFNQYVPTNEFVLHTDPFDAFKYSIGLNYIVEDKNHNIMQAEILFFMSYVNVKAEIRINNSRYFVSSNQKIKFRELNKEKQRYYDLAKYEISNKNQRLGLYPLFGIYHNNLPQGEYYLYLVYSFNISDKNMTEAEANDSRTFRGNFISNKVKFIVK